MIIDLAEDKQKEASMAKACQINILVHQRYHYHIKLVPLGSRIQIEYNKMVFAISKTNSKDYDEVVQFITDDICDNVTYNIIVDRQRNIPQHPLHRSSTLTITRGEEMLAWNKMFVGVDVSELIKRYLRPMRLLA